MKLLIVEDNVDLLDSLKSRLESEGYTCETAMTFQEALDRIDIHQYALAIVDINLPDGSGMDLIKYIKREKLPMSILVVSARNSLDDKVEGLELGADDYLTKPFSLVELSARVKAILRRNLFHGDEILSHENISINSSSREVTVNDSPVELTRIEYRIILYLINNKNRVITREALAEHIWGDHMDVADNFDFIYSHMRNLRKKLAKLGAPDTIKSVYGIGYTLKS